MPEAPVDRRWSFVSILPEREASSLRGYGRRATFVLVLVSSVWAPRNLPRIA
jgi:hypothetical protein